MLHIFAFLTAYTAVVTYVNYYLTGVAPDYCKLGICRFDGHLLPCTIREIPSHEITATIHQVRNLFYHNNRRPHASHNLFTTIADIEAALFYDESDPVISPIDLNQNLWLSAQPSALPLPSPDPRPILQGAPTWSPYYTFTLTETLTPRNFFRWCRNIFEASGRRIGINGMVLVLGLLAITALVVWIVIREINIQNLLRMQRAAEENDISLIHELLVSRGQTENAYINLHAVEKKIHSLENEPRVSRCQLVAENIRFKSAENKWRLSEADLLDTNTNLKLSLWMLFAILYQDNERQMKIGKVCDINRDLREEVLRLKTQRLEDFFNDNAEAIIGWLQEQENKIKAMQEEYKQELDQHMKRRFRLESRASVVADQVDFYRIMLDEMRAEHQELMTLVPGYQSKLRSTVTDEERKRKESVLFANERKEDLKNLQANFDEWLIRYETLKHRYDRLEEKYHDLKDRFRSFREASVNNVRTLALVNKPRTDIIS